MPSHQKDEFFQAVSPVAFRVRAASILKAGIPYVYRRLSGFDLIIQLLINLTLRASPLDISDDVLIIDGATDALRSALRVALSEECRKLKRVRPFKKIVTASSSREDGLQLADMVAGAIREKAWQNDQTYYRTFARKIVDEWEVK